MPLPAGDDHCRSLRPRPANCSPAMIIACGSESSLFTHSTTMRRATRFVDATRGITASDSSARRRGTSWRMGIIGGVAESQSCRGAKRGAVLLCNSGTLQPCNSSSVPLQLLQPRAQLRLACARLLHHVRGRVLRELLVRELRVEIRELFRALLDLAARALDL